MDGSSRGPVDDGRIKPDILAPEVMFALVELKKRPISVEQHGPVIGI